MWSFATEWTMKGHNAKLFFESSFHENHRSFRVVYGDHTDETCRSIVVRLTSVQAIAHGCDFGHPYVLFRLALPPAFEEGNFFGTGRQSRWRHSFLDAKHEASAPFAFQLLVRPSHGDSNQHAELLQKLHDASLPRPVPGNFWSFAGPGCYTPKILDRFRKWLLSIDFRVAFQLQALVSNGVTDPTTLLVQLQPPLDDLLRLYEPELCSGILHVFRTNLTQKLQLGAVEADCTKLRVLLAEAVNSHLEQTRRMQEIEQSGKLSSPSVLFSHHLVVTPSGLHLEGPDPNKSNRVLRHYDQYTQFFLRVRFANEDRLQFRWPRDVDGESFVYERVGGILKNGIEVAGRKFQFLGYSLSSLHQYSAWFVTDFYAEVEPGSGHRVRVTPQYIRDHLGNFAKVIDCPSLYGARMAQAFSATDPTITLADGEIEYNVPDIRTETGELMSDGCGTISPELSLEMNEQRIHGRTRAEWEKVVNAYQIRVGGAKGVVGVDPRLEGRKLRLRVSMIKFDALHSTDVEVANIARPARMYLNRPLIMTLETLGVRRHVFETLQANVVRTAHEAGDSIRRFIPNVGKLGDRFQLRFVLEQLVDIGCGFRDDCSETDGVVLDDSFVRQLVKSVLWETLRDVKYSARIQVPESWTLLGKVDEHDILTNEKEVMVYVMDSDYPNGKWLEGPALICRSPVMHPGDVQMVTCISPPQGSDPSRCPLINCIIFSAKGTRSLASCLAGGDYDGDEFHISQYEQLFIKKSAHPAPAPEVVERLYVPERQGTIEDVADFFVDYINRDSVGLLARQHLIIADQNDRGVKAPKCLTLAEMYSRAVDFPKTGIPVPPRDMPALEFDAKPDWITNEVAAEEAAGAVYRSTKALGHLYRAVEERQFEDLRDAPAEPQDPGALDDGITSVLAPLVAQFVDIGSETEAHGAVLPPLYSWYTHELQRICELHTLNSKAPLEEAEVLLGTILARSSQPKKRKQLAALMHVHTGWLTDMILSKLTQGLGEDPGECLTRSWAAWRYACGRAAEPALAEGSEAVRKPFGSRSFGFLALAAIFRSLEQLNQLPDMEE
ncbi:RdRP-domain-containing protein [Auricularia subglabra TFB-10046 SS5]|nr:RdRP-domain-containing protein [Auricularia subglabra TFB-10046 SS5]